MVVTAASQHLSESVARKVQRRVLPLLAGWFVAYLNQWLAPRDRAAAPGLSGSVAILSGVLGAPLAAGLLALKGTWGLARWPWLFLGEGLPAIVLGCCLLFIGPYFFGYLIDRTGTVELACVVSALTMAFGGLLALAVRERSMDRIGSAQPA